MQNAMIGIRFYYSEGLKNCLDSFLASKDERFFRDGIHKLPELVSIDAERFDWNTLQFRTGHQKLALSMQNALIGIRFNLEQDIKNWLDSLLSSKDERFLPRRNP
ncbi:unnamed protein product [Strongylus vulgaris]|uniref:Uncharacterized protein n=1 Tax=Strongylus vulgaris TaxID=40348 RepID=A0A3P7LLN4_STRVU|nr:unnamed protein product [Strongylus vulgaris]